MSVFPPQIPQKPCLLCHSFKDRAAPQIAASRALISDSSRNTLHARCPKLSIRTRGAKQGRLPLQPEEKIVAFALERGPGEPPLLVQHRIQPVEPQQPRLAMGDERRHPLRVEAQMIGAVEAGACKSGLAHAFPLPSRGVR